ncbi:MAG: hypothetical protein HY898_31055 [Deltaproteobacteria bacterium]|nr:hypothetical protein [Deltaproteobacteria bacterium]
MHGSSFPRFALLAALAWPAALACSRSDTGPQPAPSAPSAPAPNVDRLDPQEIPEGKESAFGLKLPRDMKITFNSPTEINAVGRINAERVANYVRKRVKVDGIELGAARTVFPNARVIGEPIDRPIRVEVIVTNEGTELVVRNLAKPKVLDPELTPDERKRQYGIDPNGDKIDPTKM